MICEMSSYKQEVKSFIHAPPGSKHGFRQLIGITNQRVGKEMDNKTVRRKRM